jgi:prefoldin subunit 5
MSEQLNRVEEMLTQLIKMVGANNAKLDVMADELKETKETVTRIESNQERQDRILEILSVRSIEQEANLKRLPR